MPSPQHLLLLDQGGHSSRAMLFDGQGCQLAFADARLDIHPDDQGRVEIDSRLIEQSLDQVLSDIAASARQLGISQIDRAALIVQRASFLACDKNFQPLTPVISWMDSRNHHWFAHHPEHLAGIQAISGLYPNAHYAASKIRWLLDNNHTVAQACQQQRCLFVPLAAWLARYLCKADKMVVDAVIASRTMLMDIEHFCWSEELLAVFGIQPDWLPAIVDSDYPVGDIHAGDYRIPLQLVGGDQSFVAFSAGVDAVADSAFVNAGSGAFIQAICQPPAHTRLLKSPLVKTASHCVVALEGTVNAAASALDWLFERHGRLDFEQIEQALAGQQPVPLFINTVAGSGSPHWLPQATAQFSASADVAAYAVAVLESVIFLLCDNLTEIRPAMATLRQLRISGGLSRSQGFCQKLANLSGLPVLRSDDSEASSRGLAFYLLDINAAHSGVVVQRFEPQLDLPLQQRYQQFGQLIRAYSATVSG